MKISIVATLDSKSKKMVEQFRFEYDRKLLKLFEPVIEIIPPIEVYVNLKKLQQSLANIFQRINRFKIKINGIASSLPNQPLLYFKIDEDKKLYSLREQLVNLADFNHLEDIDFSPNIPFFRFGDIDEAQTIYENLKDSNYKHQFFVERIYFIMNNNNDDWQIVEEYQL